MLSKYGHYFVSTSQKWPKCMGNSKVFLLFSSNLEASIGFCHYYSFFSEGKVSQIYWISFDIPSNQLRRGHQNIQYKIHSIHLSQNNIRISSLYQPLFFRAVSYIPFWKLYQMHCLSILLASQNLSLGAVRMLQKCINRSHAV